ncbi:hypothetical protein KIH41_05470 [Litoribacter ruber]|uniref:sensor histidine kinase n=1 Tax=Litoribacter ruber TaxID=702568 RepID=UPI001BD9B2EF|nr:ATP-binding protein [Litoribacter ruber]MBT0810725.1 hypothetical protein [Litoribacter ruber]
MRLEQSVNIFDQKLLYDHAPCGYMVCNFNRQIKSVNETFANWLHRPKDFIQGLFLDDLVDRAAQVFLTNHYLPLLKAQGSIKEAYLCFTANGIGTECSISGQVIQDFTTGEHLYFFSLLDQTAPVNIKKGFDFEMEGLSIFNGTLSKKLEEFEKFVFSQEVGLHPRIAELEEEIELLHREALFRNEGQYLANKIKNLSRVSNRMIQDFSTYYHLDTAPRMEKISLQELVHKVVRDMNSKLEMHQATVNVAELPTVYGNRKQLHLLFYHLLSNTMKFRSAAVPVVKIFAQKSDHGMTLINVMDNGKGIEKTEADKIFEFMFQVDNSGTLGAGLGMTICKKIVEIHQGKIGVNTRYGNGSSFYFTLPETAMDYSSSKQHIRS